MLCAICKASTKQGTWRTQPCVTVKLSAVKEHEKSKDHRDLVLQASADPLRVQLALLPQDSKVFQGWVHTFMDLYLMAYEEVFCSTQERSNLSPQARLEQWLTSDFAAACPNITVLILIALTIPVSSAEAERVFSTMKRIKTNLRNCLSTPVMDDLMTISCNGPKPAEFSYEEAVYRWYVSAPRRVKLGEGFLLYLKGRFDSANATSK